MPFARPHPLAGERGIATALALAAFALYAKTIAFDFMLLWDDAAYVTANPHLREITPDSVLALLTGTFSSLYAPVHMASLLLDRLLFGFDPAGYHAVNALLHALNVALVYLLVARLQPQPAIALAAALLFAVHPVNVENVAWVAERKTLLSSALALATVLYWLRFRAGGGGAAWAGCLVAFALAAFAKVTVVGVPLVLLAHEWLRVPRAERRLLPVLPLLAVSALAVALTIERAIASGRGGMDASLLSPQMLLGTIYPTMLPVYWEYLRLLAWPSGLSAYYDVTLRQGFGEPVVLASLGGLVLLLGGLLLRGNGAVRFWTVWVLATFAPMANLVPNAAVFYADRYLYLPQVGVFVLTALGVRYVWLRLAAVRPGLGRHAPVLLAALLALTVLPLAATAWQRMEVWRTELALWQDTAAKSPNLYKARLNLGVVYHRLGRIADAEREYRAALRIWPQGPEVRRNLMMLRAREP